MPAYVPPHLRDSRGTGETREAESSPPEPSDDSDPPDFQYSDRRDDGKGRKGGGKGDRNDRGDGDRGSKGGRKGERSDGDRGGGGKGYSRNRRFEEDETPGDWRRRDDGRRGGGEEKTEVEVFGEVKTRSTAGIDFDKYDAIPVKTTGENIEHIQPIARFSDAKLHETLFDNLRRCGYDRPTPVQKHSIPIVVSGRDLMACAQTGSGKTCAFMVPCLESLLRSGPPPSTGRGRPRPSPCGLVLAPTRELAVQIHVESSKFSFDSGIRCCIVYGGADMREQRNDLERGCDILIATPGRLTDMCERGNVSLELIQFFILDEADRMLDMGFEPQVRQIVEGTNMGKRSKHKRQSMMFSATFAREVQFMARDFLTDYVFISVGRVGSASELVTQLVVYAGDVKQKVHALERAVKEHLRPGGLAIIFVETKRAADGLELDLHNAGVSVTAIHGDRSQTEREEALHAFKSGTNPVMVATDVAARGLDIPNVALVINFDMPKQIDDYVHRIGRTGRAGRSGTAIAFVNERCTYLSELSTLLKEAKQDPPSWFDELISSAGRPRYGKGKGRSSESRFGGSDLREEEAAKEAAAKSAAAAATRPAFSAPGRDGGESFGNTGVEDAW